MMALYILRNHTLLLYFRALIARFRLWTKAILGVLLLLLVSFSAFTQNNYTGANNGNWQVNGNWSAGHFPTNAENATIPTGRNVYINSPLCTCASLTITSTGSISYTNGASNTLTVVNGISGTGSINLTAGTGTSTLNIGTNLTITGTLTCSNGTVNIGGTFNPKTFNSNTGTVNYNAAGAQNVGAYPYYNLTISGGNTKTLLGGVTVSNILTLTSGVLELLDNNLTLSNITTGAISVSSPGSSNMIATDGTGTLTKYGGAGGTGLLMTYPVGGGGFYSPMIISAFSGTGAAGNNITVKATSANQGSGILKKFWDVTSSYTAITSSFTFTYNNPAEVDGTQSTYTIRYSADGGVTWTAPTGTLTGAGVNPFGSINCTTFAGRWTAGNSNPSGRTYYSYQSGDWNSNITWTSDPSGTLWINPGIPGAYDYVVILNGRTIDINQNDKTVANLIIKNGAILDVNSTIGHNFGTVSGQGKLNIASTDFPDGNFTSFMNAVTGGTVEFDNASNFSINGATTPAYTFNNVIINLGSSAIVASHDLNAALTINGDLTVQNGIFQIGNSSSTTARTLTITGDVTIAANGALKIGSSPLLPATSLPAIPTHHTINFGGNLTNNGIVALTYSDVADYTTYQPSYGWAEADFTNSTQDQYVQCNNTTDFYRIVVNKGSDQTYILNIDASANNYFHLYGQNNYSTGTTNPGTPPAMTPYNSLSLQAGTCRFGPNIGSSGSPIFLSGAFFWIDSDVKLWLDGAQAYMSSATNSDGIYAYGTLQLTSNANLYLDTLNFQRGFCMRDAGNLIVQDNATLTCAQMRMSTSSPDNRGGFTMSDNAVVNLSGKGYHGDFATFSFGYSNCSVNISGGTVNIRYPSVSGNGNSAMGFSLQVGANASSTSITGGTFNIIVPTATDVYIASTMPFWNLNITGAAGTTHTASVRQYTQGGSGPNTITPQPLVVLNNLTINNGDKLLTNATNGTPAQVDLYIGNNFTINGGTTYTPGNNNTIFNGQGEQVFDNSGTITTGLYNLAFQNSSSTTLLTNNLTVTNNLTLNSGTTFNDNGKYVYVAGNVVNYGTNTGTLTSGGITLNSTSAQTITGGGIFNNLILQRTNATTVTTLSDISLTGNLRLIATSPNSANLTIGTNNLNLSAGSNIYTDLASTQSFDNNHMVITNGLGSDGGVTKTFSTLNNTFIYPFGTSGKGLRQASITINSATKYGSITVRPIPNAHPLIQSPTHAINLYWKTTSDNFSADANLSQTYYYLAADAPVPGDEVNYIPACYQVPNWNIINNTGDVLDGLPQRQIIFPAGSFTAIDGEYTCGLPAAFTGPTVYYSNSANYPASSTTGVAWNAANAWCTGSNTGTPVTLAGTNFSNCVFIIGDGSATIHKINVPANNYQTGNIQIKSDGVLDIGITNSHNFGALPNTKVSGTGKLRIAGNNYFPTGDWGDFLGNTGGTVEYYQTAAGTLNLPTTYNLPVAGSANITGYYNLSTLPYNASNIVLPNTNLIIYNNFTVGYSSGGGTANCITQINPSAATTTTLEVKDSINVNAYGILQYMNGIAQNVIADNEITVAANGALKVINGGTAGLANTLTAYGNIINNGIFNMNPAGTYACYLTFAGSASKQFTGSASAGSTSTFYNITVNKGTDPNSVIDINIPSTGNTINFNYTGASPLTLTNGTFRLTTPVTMAVTTAASFTIPATACLSSNGGTFNIATTDGTEYDIILIGRLDRAKVGCHLIVAAAGGVQFLTGGADFACQRRFDVHVDVFERRVPLKFARRGGQA